MLLVAGMSANCVLVFRSVGSVIFGEHHRFCDLFL